MNRLWLRLTLAFALVTVLGTAIAAFLTNRHNQRKGQPNIRHYIGLISSGFNVCHSER